MSTPKEWDKLYPRDALGREVRRGPSGILVIEDDRGEHYYDQAKRFSHLRITPDGIVVQAYGYSQVKAWNHARQLVAAERQRRRWIQARAA